jgi:hypothetical protein
MAHANKVAIIMDGNRRWAKKNNLPASSGHRKAQRRTFLPESGLGWGIILTLFKIVLRGLQKIRYKQY